MPRIKLDYVVSFSSEDQDNPASILLATEISRKKWLGANKGEASNSVVLQLTRSAKIFSVHIGSYDSALVEVLVGRSEAPNESYKVLILNSIFMTPVESRKGEGITKIRTFSYDQLQADTRDKCWDRIRVVCLQPYNKHCKYGLSFIHFFESDGSNEELRSDKNAVASTTAASSFAGFAIRTQSSDEDSDSSFKPGELFARLKQKNQLSTQAQIKHAGSPQTIKAMNTNSTSSNLLVKTPIQSKDKCKRSSQNAPTNDVKNGLRDDIMYRDEEEPNRKIDKIIQRDKEDKAKSKDSESSSTKHKDINHDEKNVNKDVKNKEKNEKDKGRSEKGEESGEKNQGRCERYEDGNKKDKERIRSDKDPHVNHPKNVTPKHDDRRPASSSSNSNSSRKRPSSKEKHSSEKKRKTEKRATSPHSLMRGVIFVMSGYVNPRRGTLRDKALAMGAKYRTDWGHDCTHLICAFSNTPKLAQVRKSGNLATIVTGEWIEQCSRERKLLAWQWYATEPKLRRPRDDTELQSVGEEDNPRSEEDTDDEIERVRQQQQIRKKQRTPSPTKQQKKIVPDITNSERTIETDVVDTADKALTNNDKMEMNGNSSKTKDYDSDSTIEDITEPVPIVELIEDSEEEKTEEEDNNENDSDSNDHVTVKESLPDFFADRMFAIDENISSEGFDVNLLKRYILAYDGDVVDNVYDDSRIDYVLSLNEDCKLASKSKSVKIVRPDWVWSCNDRRKKVSIEGYLVK